MKITSLVKINPKLEITSPTLLQCKSGECGECPNNTGKLLWVPRGKNNDSTFYESFSFQYNFFNKSAESSSPIKYNNTTSSTFTYSVRPDKAWAVANQALESDMSPSLMKGGYDEYAYPPAIFAGYQPYTFGFKNTGGWLFFRQPNPAIGNVHDALCFEYNHEKRLIVFRSF